VAVLAPECDDDRDKSRIGKMSEFNWLLPFRINPIAFEEQLFAA
jgi:hypothetical protein